MKKKPRRLLAKNIRKKLQKEAEELWKTYCKKRDKHCVLCKGNYILQVHHIFSRKSKSIFIDVDNGASLCRDCHCDVTWNDSAKETLRRRIDPATYDRIYEQSLLRGAYLPWKDISWLETQRDILQKMIEEL